MGLLRTKFKRDKFAYPDMTADTDPETGKRVYYTPDGPAPSVTTILASLPNPELDAWRARVGDEEADRISKEATTIGSYMHDMLESYLKDEEFVRDGSELESTAAQMAKAVKLFGMRQLNEVWGIEVPLHLEDLYAGRTDLTGVYRNLPSIIDYKTSKYAKPPEHLVKYKLQMAFYALAHEYMFGQKIEQGVLLFAIRPNPERNIAAQSNVVIVGGHEFFQVKLDAIQVLIDYWSVRDNSRLDSIERLMHMVGA